MKNKLILILLAVGVAGGGIWYLAKPKPATAPGTSTEKNQEFSGTLAEAMKLGVPMQCSWQTDKGSGESFVKGNDIYVETKTEGKTGYLLKKDDCFYSWSDDPNTAGKGFKFCQEPGASEADTGEVTPPSTGSYEAQGVDWNVKYSCHPAVFSGNKFEVPANIEFPDMQEMMKGYLPSVQQ